MEISDQQGTHLGPWISTVHLEAVGDAAPEEVWDRYAVLARWAQWSPQITGVTAPEPLLAPGLRGTVHGPLGVSLPFVVTDVDEAARRWSWEVRVGPVRLRLAHGVHAHGAGGTRATLTSRGLTPAVLTYAPASRVALARLVRP